MNGYKVDFVKNTITITADFAEKMQNPTSEEYQIIKAICADYPAMQIVKRTHKTPTKYTNKQGEKFSCNQFKNLTCERMKKFIDALPNNEGYKREFEFVRYTASRIQTNGYTLVRKWFMAQFPEFRKNPMFYLNNSPELISGIAFLNKETSAPETDDTDELEEVA